MRHALRSHGMLHRILRPFVVLALLIGLLGAGELSSAIATEFLADEEAQLTRLLNQERINRGLPSLTPNDGLRTIARRHSQRMMTEGTIFHSTTLASEVQALFPDWASIGENVGVSPTVGSVHSAFMNSPGHRANILDPDWGYLGIGIVAGGSRMFSTENFLELRPGATRPLPALFRLAGVDRYATSARIGEFSFVAGTAPGAILAPGDDFHAALAGAALAGDLGGPVVLTTPGELDERAQAALDRVLAGDARVVNVGSGAVYLTRVNESVTEVRGDDHVRVAADVARMLSRRPSAAFVTTVRDYPDALAASAVSAVTGWPILYTTPQALSAATADVLTELGIRTVYVVGGDRAVSPAVEAELRALGATTQRLAGPDRWSTAATVAEFGLGHGLRPEQVMIATGKDFPDALSAGAVASVLRSPVLLVSDVLPGPTAEWLRRHGARIDAVHVAGGSAAVSDALAAALPAATR